MGIPCLFIVVTARFYHLPKPGIMGKTPEMRSCYFKFKIIEVNNIFPRPNAATRTKMSRYRPPAPPSSPYISPEGEAAMRTELEQLWRVERPQVTQQVSEAAAMGDRSENAEYIYGKKRLREIDRRVRFLRKRLEVLKVVDQLPSDTNKVYFGAWVELLDEEDKTHRYRLVGPDEIDPAQHYISIDSVLGRALLGKSLDAELNVQTPSGPREYCIVSIHYPNTQGGK
jgi:transcription elongation factor GreB